MIDMQDPIFLRLRDSKRVHRWTVVGIAIIAALALAFPFLTGGY